jgi:hypothetical protein
MEAMGGVAGLKTSRRLAGGGVSTAKKYHTRPFDIQKKKKKN